MIKYVRGTINYGMNYSIEINSNLAGFYDVNWAWYLDDRKSTSGLCFFPGNNVVSSHRKMQNCVLPTAESDNIALGRFCTQLLSMRHTFNDYGIATDYFLVL